MAITNASRLADFGSGIGTAGAVLQIDNSANEIGIGTTNPNATLTVGNIGASGTSIYVHGDGRIIGVLTATSFSGDGSGLTGVANTAQILSNTITVSVAATVAGPTKVTDTTASTSSSTGALIVTGGVGIGKSLFVGEGISVGGTITYADVTNVDSIGIVTAGKGLRATTGGLIVTAGVSTFTADVNIGNPTPNWASRLDVSGGTNQSAITASTISDTYKTLVGLNSSGTDMFSSTGQGNTMVAGEFVVGDSMPPTYEPTSNTQAWIHGDFDGAGTGLQVGNKAAAGSSDESVFLHLAPMSGGKGVLCQSDREGTYSSAAASSASFNLQLNSENSWVERLKITPKGGFLLSNGILVERCAINTTNPWSTTNDISLDDGNVFLNTINLAGTNNTIDITSSNGLNVDLEVGDMTSVTLITAVNAATAYINHITIGAAAVTESWVGGSAPTDGGSSGYDVYTFNIIKTASATYVIIANQVKGS